MSNLETRAIELYGRVPWATLSLIAASAAYLVGGLVDVIPAQYGAALSFASLLLLTVGRLLWKMGDRPKVVINQLINSEDQPADEEPSDG